MQQPLVAPLIALCLGIVAAQWCDFAFRETLLSLIALSGLAMAALWRGAARLAAAGLLAGFAFAGGVIAVWQARAVAELPAAHISRLAMEARELYEIPSRIAGQVRTPVETVDADTCSFVLDVQRLFVDQAASGGVRVYVGMQEGAEPPELNPGDSVEFLGRLKPIRGYQNEGSFDRAAYWARQDVWMTASVRAGAPLVVRRGALSPVAEGVTGLRAAARTRFAEVFGGSDEGAVAVLRALLLGDKRLLDAETVATFRTTGTYHALVVSGLHVGILAFAVGGLLGWLGLPRWVRAGAVLGVVGVYALVSGGALPVRRAGWMLAAYLALWLLYRQRRALNILAAAAMAFLAWDPRLLFDAGFQLSFLAVALIAGVAAPLLGRWTGPYRDAVGDPWNLDRDFHLEPGAAAVRVELRSWIEPLAAVVRLPRWVVTEMVRAVVLVGVWVLDLAFVSAVIQAGLALPLAVHFQQVSFSGAVANVLLWPALMLAVPAGALALLTGWAWAGSLAVWGAGGMLALAETIAAWLPLQVVTPPPPVWLGTLFAGLLTALVFLLPSADRRWVWGAGLGAMAALVVLLVHPFSPEVRPGELEVTAIDVGQGDSLFVAFPDGETMLVDAGGLPSFSDDAPPPIDIGEAVVLPYLRSRSIQRLDVVLATHPDADHEGGIPAVLRGMSVGELWLPPESSEEWFAQAERAADLAAVPVRRMARGAERRFGKAVVHVLHPAADGAYRKTNDLSVVVGLEFGAVRFLLTGDIESRVELELEDGLDEWRGALLKVAHHGSRTSTTPEWLARVAPPLAIVSAGFLNTFGHPAPDVVRRLEASGARVVRTDVEGRVTVRSDGRRWWVETRRNELRLDAVAAAYARR